MRALILATMFSLSVLYPHKAEATPQPLQKAMTWAKGNLIRPAIWGAATLSMIWIAHIPMNRAGDMLVEQSKTLKEMAVQTQQERLNLQEQQNRLSEQAGRLSYIVKEAADRNDGEQEYIKKAIMLTEKMVEMTESNRVLARRIQQAIDSGNIIVVESKP